MTRINSIISLCSGVLVLFIAGSAFLLSFDALTALAQDVGIKPAQAWLYPAIIDGAVIIFSLSVLRANLNHEKTLYPWILVSGFTVLSVSLNIIHAPKDFLSQFMAAIPPIALFLSFELLMSQIKAITLRISANQSLDEITALFEAKQTELDELITNRTNELDNLVQDRTQILEKLDVQIGRLENQKKTLRDDVSELRTQNHQLSLSNTGSIEHARAVRASNKQQAMNQLLSYLQENPRATLSQMAGEIGRSKSTAGIYVSELQSSGLLQKNGKGWQIKKL